MSADVTEEDEKALQKLGLDQVLKRDLNTFGAASVTFAVQCAPGTITSTFALAWDSGGPAACVHGWLVSTLTCWALGLSMAEITSALPSCGGPYFWASVLGRDKGPVLGWLTGWFSFIGGAALAGAYAAGILQLITSLMQVNYKVTVTPAAQLGIYTACLILSGAIAALPARVLAHICAWGSWWIFCSIFIVALTLPSVAPWRQSAHFIFAKFNDYSTTGIRSSVYLFLENCMVAQFCVIGYDACAHMSEETQGAQKSIPRAIVAAIVASGVLGYIYIVSLLLSIQNPAMLMTGNAEGFVAAQIFYDAFKARYGDGRAGTILMVALPGSATFVAVVATTLSASRMAFSFAKSGGIPFGAFFSVVNKHTHTPIRTVVLLAFTSFLFGLPLLKSPAAFAAIVSMANISLLISYAIPIFCRHTFSRNSFAPGPFTLGPYSAFIGWSGVLWTALSTVVFFLPSQFPVTTKTVQYPALLLILVFAGCLVTWYFPKHGAKNHFRGPNTPNRIARAMSKVRSMKLGRSMQLGQSKRAGMAHARLSRPLAASLVNRDRVE